MFNGSTNKQATPVAPNFDRTPTKRSRRRTLLLCLFPIAIGAFLVLYVAAEEIAVPVDPPDAVKANPAYTTATITDSYINGLGGDPVGDYTYTVNGHQYSGTSTAFGHHEATI